MTSCHLEKTVLLSLPATADRIVVAVSGGMDSVVLLHLLHAISRLRPLALQVVHLNHQIRPEGGADAGFVEWLCRRLQVPCQIESCDVPGLAAAEGISLEMAGRLARRDLLQRIAADSGAGLIALGHHRDDQVETFLLRLVRGSGLSGLTAMLPLSGIWWRPLLDCSRRQIRDYAQRHELSWVEDKSNQDADFVRNRLRIEVLPLLQTLNPRFAERVTELSRQIQVEEDCWRIQVDTLFPALIEPCRDGLRLRRKVLLAQHPALRMRLLREALRRIRGHLQGIEATHLRAFEALLDGSRSQAQLDLPQCWVARRYESLWLRPEAPLLAAPFDYPLTIPGKTLLPDGQVLTATIDEVGRGESRDCIELDPERISAPLRVRSWRPGDRLAPSGMAGHKRLKCLFSDLRLEREQRLSTALLVSGGTLLWVVGVRRSRHALVDSGSGSVLRLKLDKKTDN